MQDPEKLREIESLGQEDEEQEEQREKYQEIAEWYGQEMAQEIELPHLEKAVPEPSESPAPESAPVETPSPIQIDSAPPQML